MPNSKYFKLALYKALFVTIIYIISYIFYNNNFIRENVEDIAFDIVSKFSIKTTVLETNSPQIMVFAIDNLYMQEHKLYDEQNKSSFGYLFPRDKLSDLISNIDELTNEIESKNLPKALFIDYDMSFTTMPYGKELSKEDKRFLEVLKRKRDYVILLPKTGAYNFVEYNNDIEIQEAIKKKRIIFVSVPFLKSNDGIVRRYQSYKKFSNKKEIKEYIGVWIALWQIMHSKEIDLNSSKKYFLKDDIVGNRIFLKSYHYLTEEDECSVQKSYWANLTKYSANCSLFDIVEEDFSNSILIVGGTYTQNNDNFNVNNVLGSESFTGVDIHANTLMTLLYLNGSLKRLPIYNSLILVFLIFFLLTLFISWIFRYFKIDHTEREFLVLVLINTIVFVSVSVYLLTTQQLWFNWFVPWAALGLVEFFAMISSWIPQNMKNWRKK